MLHIKIYDNISILNSKLMIFNFLFLIISNARKEHNCHRFSLIRLKEHIIYIMRSNLVIKASFFSHLLTQIWSSERLL